MKQYFLIGIASVLILTSCTSTHQPQAGYTTKPNVALLKGNWIISSVTYDKEYKIKPFDEGADAQCFIGSVWKLVPNNYSGSYTINASQNCPSSVTRNIKFQVTNQNQFIFKKINDGTKAKDNSAGYSLTLLNISETKFSLQQNISFEESTIQAIYNFTKVDIK